MPDPTPPGPYRLVKVVNDSLGAYDAQIAVEVCDTCGCLWMPREDITHCPNYYREDHP